MPSLVLDRHRVALAVSSSFVIVFIMFTDRCRYPPTAVHIELPADAQISSLESRREHFATKLAETTIDNRGCYKIIKEQLHSNKHSTKRDAAENQKICDAFYNFSSKIAAIATKIKSILDSGTRRTSVPQAHITPMRFTWFVDISDDEAIREILDIPDTTSPMDFISTSILKDGCDVFGSLIAMLASRYHRGNSQRCSRSVRWLRHQRFRIFMWILIRGESRI